jgi:7-carboxy-7-deazaguanine synthase
VLTLPVAEVFGPVWQGEGPHTGRLCGFLRLSGCNLTCEWCDTPWTWDSSRFDVAAECPDATVEALASAIQHLAPMMVLTGGEPMLHAKRRADCPLAELLEQTRATEWHVETNGTIPPPAWMSPRIAHWTVSPKVNTRDCTERRLNVRALGAFAALGAAFKFVCRSPEDISEVALLVADLTLPPGQVWVMPEGITGDGVLTTARKLAPHVLERGFNLTLRQHVLLYEDRRGV